jgi:hypothetical protein
LVSYREAKWMMGPRVVEPASLFYEFSLDADVPADQSVRAIDRFVDLGDVRRHLGPFYSPTGRPSVDPEPMIRMPLVGDGFGIRSERRSCEEVHLNLAYRPSASCRRRPFRGRMIRLLTDHGSAGSVSTAAGPIIRPSPRTGTAASATAISCGTSSRRWSPAA